MTSPHPTDAYWKTLGLAAPARRALVGAGLSQLAHLSTVTREAVAALHGMGPNALAVLDRELAAAGRSFKRSR